MLFVIMVFFSEIVEINRSKDDRALIPMLLFAVGLALSMVIGYHIHVEDFSSGHIDVNYLAPFELADIGTFFCMLPGLLVLSLGFYYAIGKLCETTSRCALSWNLSSMRGRRMAVYVFVLFVAWLPYLLAFWPGYILGDSLRSIWQAYRLAPLNNHDPIAYTLLLRMGIDFAHLLNLSGTFGLGLITVLQMLFMAGSLGLLVEWISMRVGLKGIWPCALLVLFACTPYVASLSVTFWKDPIFTSSLIILSLMLMDLVLTEGDIAVQKRWWLPVFVLMLLISTFSRNNGVYVLVLVALGLLLLFVARTKQRISHAGVRRSLMAVASVILMTLVVTGPVYRALDWKETRAESVGVFLNQMARVVVYDGDMTDLDKEYMESLLPIEQYAEVYTPCCVDGLKWSEGFNNGALEHGFFSHWLSMAIRNPKLYFESWVLETYGFWTVNCPDINSIDWNIGIGVVKNDNYSRENALYGDIVPENLLDPINARDYLATDEWSIPIGWIVWAIIYLCIVLYLRKQSSWIVALLPSIGLVGTLVVASPIRYWSRYAILLQFLVPFYLALFLVGIKGKEAPDNSLMSSCNSDCEHE